MRLLEVMERVSSRDTKKIIKYIEEAYEEIQSLANQTIEKQLISVVAGTREYTLPSDLFVLKGVYQLHTQSSSMADTYIRIPNITNIDLIQSATASTATTDDEIIII